MCRNVEISILGKVKREKWEQEEGCARLLFLPLAFYSCFSLFTSHVSLLILIVVKNQPPHHPAFNNISNRRLPVAVVQGIED